MSYFMLKLREEPIDPIGSEPGTPRKWLWTAQGLKLNPMFANKVEELLKLVQSLIFCLKVWNICKHGSISTYRGL